MHANRKESATHLLTQIFVANSFYQKLNVFLYLSVSFALQKGILAHSLEIQTIGGTSPLSKPNIQSLSPFLPPRAVS